MYHSVVCISSLVIDAREVLSLRTSPLCAPQPPCVNSWTIDDLVTSQAGIALRTARDKGI